jgi:membrane protease YdiL (CAAX protease family)
MNIESTSHAQTPKKHARLAFFWTILGALSVLAVFPYLLAILPTLTKQLPMPMPVLVLAQLAQTSVLLLLLSWIGLRLGQSVGLDSPFARAFVYGLQPPSVSRGAIIFALSTGIVGGLIILGLDRLFRPFMPATTQPIDITPELWKRLLASFYGGIVEELLLRLFLMTLIVWIIWKTVLKGQRPPTALVFWIAIVVAAILFGAGHLPAAAGIWPLTLVVISRTILLNAILGIAFGFIYWQWGLEYAMLAHFCADIVIQFLSGS